MQYVSYIVWRLINSWPAEFLKWNILEMPNIIFRDTKMRTWLTLVSQQTSGQTAQGAMGEWWKGWHLNSGIVGSSASRDHDHDSSHGIGTVCTVWKRTREWFIFRSCDNSFHNRAKTNMFKLYGCAGWHGSKWWRKLITFISSRIRVNNILINTKH